MGPLLEAMGLLSSGRYQTKEGPSNYLNFPLHPQDRVQNRTLKIFFMNSLRILYNSF